MATEPADRRENPAERAEILRVARGGERSHRRSEKAPAWPSEHASATQESERRIAARSQIEDKSTEALGRRVGSRVKQGRVTDRHRQG